MTRMDQIRALPTVAACHEWRAGAGELNSMETAAYLARVAALRKYETGDGGTLPPEQP